MNASTRTIKRDMQGVVREDHLPGLRISLSLQSNLDPLERQWKEFEQFADCTAFQSYDWLSAWQFHIGSQAGTTPCVILGFDDAGGRLLFIFPLAIRAGVLARLTWLGSELCDYNAPLLAPGFKDRIGEDFQKLWDVVLSYIADAGLRFDIIHLEKMPHIVGSQPNPFMQLQTSRNPSSGHVSLLTGNWDEFYQAKRSSGRRKSDRNRVKRLAGYGDVRLVSPGTPEDTQRTVQKLFRQKSWAFERRGVADLFSRPGYRELFSDLALQEQHLCHISRLEVGPIWAATNFGLTFKGSYYHVLCSYEQRAIAAFGPGSVHLRELMRFAIEQGLRRFDFTIGDEPYKREWSDLEIQLHDHVSGRTSRSWPHIAAIRTRRYLKRSIKQNRYLWRGITAARQAIAVLRARLDTGTAAGRRLMDKPESERPS